MFGCSEEPPAAAPEVDACKALNEQRAECGLGAYACKTSYDACYAECMLGWECVDLENPAADPGIAACLWNCSPRFECDDGSEIYAAFRCDSVGDCPELEDEQGCPSADAGIASITSAHGSGSGLGGDASVDASLVDAGDAPVNASMEGASR